MRPEELFANDVRVALDSARTARVWPLIAVGGGMVMALLLWAGVSELDEVATGPGRVIPSSQTQVVQTLEPGIVAAVLVKVGDTVEPGQVLIRLEDVGAASQLGEIRQRRSALQARRERLLAEVAGRAPRFEGIEADASVIAAEQTLFENRATAINTEVEVAEQQLTQRRQERTEVEIRLAEAERLMVLLDKELDMARALAKKGVYPEIELLRQERQAQAEKRDATVLRASLPRIGSAVAEAEARLSRARDGFRATAQEELAKTLGDLSVIEETIKAAQDRNRRTALRSPVRGVVNLLPTTSIGAVLQAGQHAAEIVPLDDMLLVEARIRPQDIAFIRPGQSASTKISAYDYTIYGDLPGEVQRISADTRTDPQGQVYYEVVVRTHVASLGKPEAALTIIPGMVAKVDIQTGSKTVLDYLIKPIRKASHEALRER